MANKADDDNQPHMSQEMTMAKAPTLRTRLTMIKSDIIKSFQDLGVVTHKPPRSKDNRASIAWDLFVAYTLKASAEVRYKKAAKAAVVANIMFDHEAHPLPPGTKQVIYAGDQVTVSVEVRTPYEKVDTDKLVSFLIGRNVNAKDLHDAVAHATTITKPAHVFRAELTE